jgi:hypothetical protein
MVTKTEQIGWGCRTGETPDRGGGGAAASRSKHRSSMVRSRGGLPRLGGACFPSSRMRAGLARLASRPAAPGRSRRLTSSLARTHNPLYLRHLERFELGSPYPEVIERVIRLLTRHPIRAHLDHTRLLAHRTGAMGTSS